MKIREKILDVEKNLNEFYYERGDAIRAISIGLLSNLNVILVGPPGTAKTDISKSWTSHVKDAEYFGTTLNAFTTPDEIFGTFDFKKMKEEGIMVRKTEGYLPSCHIGAIEEIFKAGKGTLNSLIEISHPSRLFSNGPKQIKTNILTLIGTSNELPVDEQDLSAIYDRMIIKIYVKPIEDKDKFGSMITNRSAYDASKGPTITLNELKTARAEVSKIEITEQTLKTLITIREDLAKNGVYPSDRTFKNSITAIQAQSYLNNKNKVDDDDLMFLKHMLWHDPTQESIVWRSCTNTLKPELRRLSELLVRTQQDVQEALNTKNDKDMISIHRKTQEFVREAKKLRSDMIKKDRSVTECDEIISKLKSYLRDLGKELIGEETQEENQESYF